MMILLFVYSINHKENFEDLNERIRIAKDVNDNFKGAIIANKYDLNSERVISDEQWKELSKKNNYKFYSASAKDNSKGFIKFIEELIKVYNFYYFLFKLES